MDPITFAQQLARVRALTGSTVEIAEQDGSTYRGRIISDLSGTAAGGAFYIMVSVVAEGQTYPHFIAPQQIR